MAKWFGPQSGSCACCNDVPCVPFGTSATIEFSFNNLTGDEWYFQSCGLNPDYTLDWSNANATYTHASVSTRSWPGTIISPKFWDLETGAETSSLPDAFNTDPVGSVQLIASCDNDDYTLTVEAGLQYWHPTFGLRGGGGTAASVTIPFGGSASDDMTVAVGATCTTDGQGVQIPDFTYQTVSVSFSIS